MLSMYILGGLSIPETFLDSAYACRLSEIWAWRSPEDLLCVDFSREVIVSVDLRIYDLAKLITTCTPEESIDKAHERRASISSSLKC